MNDGWKLINKKDMPDAMLGIIQAEVRAAEDEDGQVRCRSCYQPLEKGQYVVSLMGEGVRCFRTECNGDYARRRP